MTVTRFQRTNRPIPIIGKTAIGQCRLSADYRCISKW